MKRKIIGIFICILFLTTAVASATNTFQIDDEKSFEKSSDNRLFVFGRMEQVYFDGGSVDFQVINFVFIKDGKDIYKLYNEEIIKFYAPMVAILINKIVIGFFSDWEVLE